MKRYVLLLFIAVFALSGCYKDKGNYDYTDITQLAIAGFEVDSYSVGQEIVIKPEVTPVIDPTSDRYTFKWYLKDYTEDSWNKLEFKWVATKKTEGYEELRLEIYDKQTGVTYIQKETIEIEGKYVGYGSYLVLSEDGGVAKLHHLKYTDWDERPDPLDANSTIDFPIDWNVDYNAYEKNNNSQPLGQNPISIQEHCIKDNGGQYCVFQQSGAVDVESDYLKMEMDFKTTFLGGGYPEGVRYLSGGTLMKWVDIVTDQDGRIFTRFKDDENLYHSSSFSPKPVEFEGEVLKNCTVFRNDYNSPGYAVISDPDNGRLLIMFDGGNGDAFLNDPLQNAGVVMVIPNADPVEFPDLRNFDGFENCEIKTVVIKKGSGKCHLYIIYKNESGEIYLQRSDINKSYYGIKMTNLGGKVEKLNIPSDVKNIYVPSSKGTHLIFYSVAEKLYLIDLQSGDLEPKLYFTADSEIRCMDTNNWRINNLVIGTKGGYFYHLDTKNAKNKVSSKLEDSKKVIFKLDGFGSIINVKEIRGVNHQNYN